MMNKSLQVPLKVFRQHHCPRKDVTQDQFFMQSMAIGLKSRVFASGPGDQSSIPG